MPGRELVTSSEEKKTAILLASKWDKEKG